MTPWNDMAYWWCVCAIWFAMSDDYIGRIAASATFLALCIMERYKYPHGR